MQSNTQTGIVPRILAQLFGERVGRLTERAARAHWLSYVLILSQSAAVLLVFGHAELPLLASPSWAVRAIAAMGLFLLVATVVAADLAMLETLRRIPILARNRQRWALREHLCYTLFVLLTEAVTLGVVLSTLDADPTALISARPLIPPQGLAFRAQIVLRVVLISWTSVQLIIVRGKLPVLLSTLTATGREIVGAHVERRLASLDIGDIHLPAAFRTYAAMSKPPRRIRTWANGWLVERERAAEAEEERQVANVVSALEDLERRHNRAIVAPDVAPPPPLEEVAPDAPTRPPTGPGSPTARPRMLGTASAATGAHKRAAVIRLAEAPRRGSNGKGVRTAAARSRTETVERRARAVWQPAMSVGELERAAGISRNAASKWRKILLAETTSSSSDASAGDLAQ